MKVLLFPIGKMDTDLSQDIKAWTNQVPDVEWENPPAGTERESASRAAWRGFPFVIAGERKALDHYFDSLDDDSLEVLQDCAYFWVLTDSSDYVHKAIPADRPAALDWATPTQYIISAALNRLTQFPRLIGLSRTTHILRARIDQLAKDRTGPGCSVLILGPSGSGKEEVAQSLVGASSRKEKGMQALSGAWLNMEPGMAMTEVVGLERGRPDERIDGLLAQLSDRAMFIDDFESAAACVQETLLRVMSVPEREAAPFRPVGGLRDRFTKVWPIFATNRDVESFLRSDFLYRFGARVIWLLPLCDRPADLPAIAQAVWARIWDNFSDNLPDERQEPLRSAAVKHLYGKHMSWEGNVRSLSALLKLVAAEMREPAMNGWSQTRIIDEITSRGPKYLDWVSAYARRSAQNPAPGSDGRPTQSDELALKSKLESLLQPNGIQLVEKLNEALWARPKNNPGRHLFYAALIFVAQKKPPEAGSADLRRSLCIESGHVNALCSAMAKLFQGPLAQLCTCSQPVGKRYHVEIPPSIIV
jgi:DNA-binding NtrC family response regulator